MSTKDQQIVLSNAKRYVSPDLILKCFEAGRVTHVDKQMCGNGFTTAFASIKPPPGKTNILIEANKEVVLSKEKAYQNGTFAPNLNVVFRYQESKSIGVLFYDKDKHVDLIICVADSFLLLRNILLQYVEKIDKILIDEYHSIQQQSSYRTRLIDFISNFEEFTRNGVSVTTVSATPNLYASIDIVIKNKFQPEVLINQSRNQKKCLERIRESINQGHTTVVFSNNARFITHLKNPRNNANPHVLEARFHCGKTLLRKLVQFAKIKENDKANLIIVSSRGFDGFDILDDKCHIYFIENRKWPHETFFISNLYQSLNRARGGAEYIEYCRIENQSARTFLSQEEVLSFIQDSNYTVEQKHSTDKKKPFYKFHKYVIFKPPISENDQWQLIPNEYSIILEKEKQQYDCGLLSSPFKEFLANRKISVHQIEESPMEMRPSKFSNDFKVNMLKENVLYIDAHNLFGDDYKPKIEPRSWQSYAEVLQEYFMCKNYSNQYTPTQREQIALRILQSENELKQLLRKMYQLHKQAKELRFDKVESQNEWIEKNLHHVCKLIILFSQNKIKIPRFPVVNRDYNVITRFSNSAIGVLLDAFNLFCIEVDIKSCNPQILYLINDLGRLPEDFYGPNKINKRKVNISLNTLSYTPHSKTEKKHQKQNKKRGLQKLGFPERLVNWLLDKYFETKAKGQLAHDLAYHEQKIISEIKNLIRSIKSDACTGMIRKHDALLIIEPQFDIRHAIANYSYKGLNGLFSFKIIGSKFESLDAFFEQFTTNNQTENNPCDTQKLLYQNHDFYLNNTTTRHKSTTKENSWQEENNWIPIENFKPSNSRVYLFQCRVDYKLKNGSKVLFSKTHEIVANAQAAIKPPKVLEANLETSIKKIISFKHL